MLQIQYLQFAKTLRIDKKISGASLGKLDLWWPKLFNSCFFPILFLAMQASFPETSFHQTKPVRSRLPCIWSISLHSMRAPQPQGPASRLTSCASGEDVAKTKPWKELKHDETWWNVMKHVSSTIYHWLTIIVSYCTHHDTICEDQSAKCYLFWCCSFKVHIGKHGIHPDSTRSLWHPWKNEEITTLVLYDVWSRQSRNPLSLDTVARSDWTHQFNWLTSMWHKAAQTFMGSFSKSSSPHQFNSDSTTRGP